MNEKVNLQNLDEELIRFKGILSTIDFARDCQIKELAEYLWTLLDNEQMKTFGDMNVKLTELYSEYAAVSTTVNWIEYIIEARNHNVTR